MTSNDAFALTPPAASLHPDVLAARDLILRHRSDYDAATESFEWPSPATFNFATDWFDGLVATQPDDRALWIVDGPDDEGVSLTFAELYGRSVAATHWLAANGVGRGDRLLLMLGNCVPIWEIMLAAMRLGVVVIPATPLLSPADLEDRLARGQARLAVCQPSDVTKFDEVSPRPALVRAVVGEASESGWVRYDPGAFAGVEPADWGTSAAQEQQLLYFTSGTTSEPKLVEHTCVSYPIGHLSTLYWMGLQPGDIHLNISSPGWGKHAWSNFFGPWLAGATVLVYNYARFEAASLLGVLHATRATTFCAPPTVWRMLVQTNLDEHEVFLRECLSAGEPLNPEVIARVQHAWNLTIRDGYGQTETTCSVGNTPGQPVKPGAMGRPMPGYRVVLIDPVTGAEAAEEGEICLPIDPPPLPLTPGYRDTADVLDVELTDEAMRDGYYHSGDVVSRDADGYLTYIGRADDVFKASDYKISPFELESVLIEHPAVAEAAIVPSPDPLRLAVPKAYVLLTSGHSPDEATARSIIAHVRSQVSPYKRVKRLTFVDELPKTISGKIRRVDLRGREARAIAGDVVPRLDGEFWSSDFGL